MLRPDDIKEIRNRLEESQAIFGQRFGVDQSTVHRWETYGLPDHGAAKTAVERFAIELAPSSEDEKATQ